MFITQEYLNVENLGVVYTEITDTKENSIENFIKSLESYTEKGLPIKTDDVDVRDCGTRLLV